MRVPRRELRIGAVGIARPLFLQLLQLGFRGSIFEGVGWAGVARLAQQAGRLIDVLAKHGILADKKIRLAALVPLRVRIAAPCGEYHVFGVDVFEIECKDRPGPGIRVDLCGITL